MSLLKKIIEVGEWDSHRAIGSCTKAFDKNKYSHLYLI